MQRMTPLVLIVAFGAVIEPALFFSKLQGAWQITALHAAGFDLTDTAKAFSLTIRGDTLTLPDGEKSRFVVTRVDGEHASVTFFNQHGRPFNGIVRVKK